MFTEEYCCIIMEGTTQSEYAGYFTVTFYVIVKKDGGNVLLPKNIVKPFWSWNDSLEKEELCRQIDLMKQNGIDGFFMHARGGLVTEYMSDEWFDCIEACIKQAEKLGMEAWAYDENGWPSGFANGIVPQRKADYRQKLLKTEAAEDICKLPENVLGFYEIKNDGFTRLESFKKGCLVISFEENPYYTDLLNKEAIKCFINETHEKYYHRLSGYFSKSFKGFFTDEPQYSRISAPWTGALPQLFKESYGYSVLENLPLLFYEFSGYEAFRSDYYSLVSRQFRKAFLKQIYDWCEEHNCKLTGHMMGEDGLLSQTESTGGVMSCYEYFHEPGIDWLGRQVSSPIVPKQLGSVAKQLGRKTLSESFAMCGWNVSLNELKWISMWQLVNGVTAFCPHLEGYSLRGYRKRDYPASIFSQLPWFDEVNNYFTEYVGRVGSLLDEGEEDAPLLVIQPLQTAYISYNPINREAISKDDWLYADTMQRLSAAHILHHYGDEEIIARYGSIEGDMFKVGNCRYSAVLLPNITSLTADTYNLLKAFAERGGRIYVLGKVFSFINGRPFTDKELVSRLTCVSSIEELKQKSVGLRFADIVTERAENGNIHYTKRFMPNGEGLYYFVNLSKEPQSVTISLEEENAYIYSPVNNESAEIPFEKRNGKIFIRRNFDSYGSLMLKSNIKGSIAPMDNRAQYNIPLREEWKIKSCTPNALTLDFCRYRIDGGEWQEECAVIILQRRLLELKRPCRVEMMFSFEVKEGGLCEDMSLCAENPERYIFEINGKNFDFVTEGYFVDKSVCSCNISKFVTAGINTITMRCDFFQKPKVYDVLFTPNMCATERNKLTYDTEIESIYLTGSFGVQTDEPYTLGERDCIHAKRRFYLTEQPKTVNISRITENGFWFFAGKMGLLQNADIKKEANKRYILKVKDLKVPAAKVYINNHMAGILGFTPYELDVSDFIADGNNTIEIRLLSGNRNLLGPHHKPIGECYNVCPDTFTDKNGWSDDASFAPWTDNYNFVAFGIVI